MKKLTLLTALLCASLLTFAIDSEYCGEVMSSGNTEAAFTWETDNAGVVTITITETLGGTAESTHFRGNGININKIKIGEQREDAADYFTLACGGKPTITLTPKDGGKTIEPGTKIYVENQIIEYATSKDGNAWPTLTFIYTYGGVCSAEPVLTRINFSAATSFTKVGEGIALNVSPVDQLGKPMDVTVNFTISPADAGVIENNVYKPSKVGGATITAQSGDISASLTLYGVPSDNLALNQPCEAGYEPNNAGEVSSKANDGNTNTQWVTYADKPASVEWWIVDLGGKYDIAAIDVVWGDPTSTQYILQVRETAPSDEQKADDEAWETISTQEGVTINSEQFIVVHATGRYVRLHSLAKSANYFRLKEVRVFGTEWVPTEDNEKPVMTSAELVSKTWKKAIISVAATDNIALKSYHVVDAAKQIDVKLVDTDGKITVTGLEPSTAYNFTITAIDAANNESDNSKTVTFTTDSNVPTTAAPVPTWPAKQVKSLYSDTYEFAPSGLNSYNEGWWQNPNMKEEEINGDHYLLYDLYRDGMIGVQFGNISVATMEKIHIDIYASAAGSVTFRPITEGGPNNPKTLTLEAGKWNSFDLDTADFKGHNWSKLYQYAIEKYYAGGLVGENIAVDNVFFYRTTELVDTEKPTDVTASKVSEDIFSVVIAASAKDNSGAVGFIVKNGEQTLATGGGASGATVNITVSGLMPNTEYNLSVIATDEGNNAADAVTVAVKTLAAPAPAPKPDFTGKIAVPVFCDALDSNPGINIGGWGQSTQAQVGQLAEGDNVFYGTNFNYLGWELNPSVNATGMEYVHVDFYTTDMQSIQLTPISPNHEGIQTVTLEANAWKSADIQLSGYETANIDWSNIFQFKFMEATPAGKALFIDNVYFYKIDEGTALDNLVETIKATKVLRDGQLFIIRDGQTYTIQGTIVR